MSSCETMRLSVGGMTCATCAGRIEKILKRRPGVISAQVNLASEIATAAIDPEQESLESVVAAIEKAGFSAEVSKGSESERQERIAAQQKAEKREVQLVLFSLLLTMPLLLPMFFMPFGIHWEVNGWLQLVLAGTVQIVAGAKFYKGAFSALRAKSSNMDVLVALGTSAAFALSLAMLFDDGPLYFEASASILCFVRLGKMLEAKAKRKTGDAIAALLEKRPPMARVLRDGKEYQLPPEALGVGELFLVRPGESIPLDGIVVEGRSELDEAHLSGESKLVAKAKGDTVYAASINSNGVLKVESSSRSEDSRFAQILSLVEEAQSTKAPIQNLVDKVAAVFVPIVVGISLVSFIAWLLAGAAVNEATIFAVSVLVIACPCALGLATPAALMVGSGALAQRGILMKDASVLEKSLEIDRVIFDKTGTLTTGKMRVTELLSDSPQELLGLAASVQQGSEHPIAKAIVREAVEQGVKLRTLEDGKALPGQGVYGRIDSRDLWICSPAYLRERGLEPGKWEQVASAKEAQGETLVWMCDSEKVLGAFALGDTLRDSSALAVERLRGLGVESWIVSGDNQAAVGKLAQELGIDEAHGQVLPGEKYDIVSKLKKEGHHVAMIGDGINDAPALAAADLSIAMAGGSDVAMHTAGMTLIRPEPALVAESLALSRATVRNIRQNLFWAFAYNVIGIPLAAFGMLSPMLASAAMALSSVFVLGNALRLRKWRAAWATP